MLRAQLNKDINEYYASYNWQEAYLTDKLSKLVGILLNFIP